MDTQKRLELQMNLNDYMAVDRVAPEKPDTFAGLRQPLMKVTIEGLLR